MKYSQPLLEQYTLRAWKLARAGRYQESLAQLRLAQAVAPELAELRLQAGILLLEAYTIVAEEKFLREAQSEFRAALAIRPDWPEAMELLAKCDGEAFGTSD